MTIQRGAKPIAPDNAAMEAPHTPRRRPGKGSSPTWRAKPGSMPENPGNVDKKHEPAGLEQGESRLEHLNQHRRKD